MQTKNHFLALDGFRGIAALLVVIRHVPTFFDGNPFQQSYLAVDLFFLLSGAVVARAYERRLLEGMTFARFTWIRLLRLYPMYFLGTLIGIGTLIFAPHSGHLTIAIILNLLFLPAINTHNIFPFNGPAWSLSAEMAINLFYGWKVRILTDRALVALGGICMLALVAYLIRIPEHSLDGGFARRSVYLGYLRVGFSFLAGILLYRIFARRTQLIHNDNRKVLLMLGAVAVLLAASPAAWAVPWYDIATIAIAFPLLVYAGMHYQPHGLVATLCKQLGIISYPIYVLHGPLGRVVRQWFEAHGTQPLSAYTPGIGFVFLVAMVFIAWAAHHYFDEPVRRLIGAMAERRLAHRRLHQPHDDKISTP